MPQKCSSSGVSLTPVWIPSLFFFCGVGAPDIFSNVPQLAPAITQQGQWYRLVTPVLLHASFMHIWSNNYGCMTVGPRVSKLCMYDGERFVGLCFMMGART